MRRGEIEEAVRTRVFGVSDPLESIDPEYAAGLRVAIRAAVDHGLSVLELGEEPSSPPPSVLAQARLAARNGLSLDTVLRRYVAGHALFADLLVEEAGTVGLESGDLRHLLRSQAALLDRLLAAVGEEHAHEVEGHLSSAERRDAERVERLLAGEALDTSQLPYEFKAHHLAIIAKGPGSVEAIRALAEPLDRRLLLINRKDGTIWAWLGGRQPIDPLELRHEAAAPFPQASLALGEPAEGLGGWRLTHRQAKAALPIALRGPRSLIRYADVALLASIVQDELLSTSLRALYLAPLDRERDGGEVARETLRAYFATECNVSSAAALLGVSRQTVASRLRVIERRIGRPLSICGAEMEAALRFHDFD